MDLYDYKPKMGEWFDKDLPETVRMGQRLTTMTSGQNRFPIAPSIFEFKQPTTTAARAHGSASCYRIRLLWSKTSRLSNLYTPKRLTMIRRSPMFVPAMRPPGKPSLGAWLSYGLGTENNNLPSFIVMNATWTGRKSAQALYNRLWGAGFLPSEHQGVLLRSQGDPVLFLSNPQGMSEKRAETDARFARQTQRGTLRRSRRS